MPLCSFLKTQIHQTFVFSIVMCQRLFGKPYICGLVNVQLNKILFLLTIGDRLGSFRYNRRFCIHHKSFVIDSWVLKCNMNLFLLKQGWSLTTQSELLYTLHQFDCSPLLHLKPLCFSWDKKKCHDVSYVGQC